MTSSAPSAPIRRSSASGTVPAASPSMRTTVVERRALAADALDLRELLGVLAEDRDATPECRSTYAHSSGEFVG